MGLAFSGGLAHTGLVNQVAQGCQLFQTGQPFEAHEAWEAEWNRRRRGQDPEAARELQAAILLCGVWVLLDKQRARGAVALARRALELEAGFATARVLRWDDPAAVRRVLAGASARIEAGEGARVVAQLAGLRVAPCAEAGE